MPTIPLHPTPTAPPPPPSSLNNPLPPLLHTPHGLALLELQGTIHFPAPAAPSPTSSTLVGHLTFPLYDAVAAQKNGDDGAKWMKKVYFWIGDGQRMSGEVRRLGRPFAVVRRRGGDAEKEKEELEVLEIVRYKIVFSHRPEPVGGMESEMEVDGEGAG